VIEPTIHPLLAWAERSGNRLAALREGGLCFAFYGRASTEDHPAKAAVAEPSAVGRLIVGMVKLRSHRVLLSC
jgi:hypothetical protein